MMEQDLLNYDKYRFEGETECVVLHEKGDELIPYQESIVNVEGKARLILTEEAATALNIWMWRSKK